MDYTQGPPPPPSASAPPPSPHQVPPAPKKGLHPLAWAGIGCGGVMLLGGIAAVILMVKVGKEVVKEVSSAMKAHPGKDAVVRLIERMPDYEKVSEDAEKGDITLRSKADGVQVVTNYDSLVLGTSEVKDSSGSLRPIASGDLTKIPEWVPRYSPADKEACVVQRDDATETSGVLAFTTMDPLDDVMAFYGKQADSLSLNASATTSTTFADRVSRSQRLSGGKRTLEIHAHGVAGPPWIVQVVYEERK